MPLEAKRRFDSFWGRLMKFVADLHIHSKYSRATSADMDVDHLNKWARIKGIKVLGTGDFTHHLWLKELKSKLEPAEQGLFKVKKSIKANSSRNNWLPQNGNSYEKKDVRFLLTSEISCIYSKNNKVRKIHILVFAPGFKEVEKINARLGWIGNIKSDGRPILGLDVKELAKIIFNVSEDCLIIPAHIWTPWFSLFGASSGFDSIEECFDDYSKYIYAAETGLSSDPVMNRQWSSLDKITLISNSDAHSPSKIGREANVFNTELSYKGVVDAIKNNDPKKFVETIEFLPEEGKYYYDGHRKCNICLSPKEAKKISNICPKCKKSLTIGVCHRIDDLADRKKSKEKIPFRYAIPLEEVIANAKGVGVASKKVAEEYRNIIKRFESEFKVLLSAETNEIRKAGFIEIADGIEKVRKLDINIDPGYDGEYGKVSIFSERERDNFSKQASLF